MISRCVVAAAVFIMAVPARARGTAESVRSGGQAQFLRAAGGSFSGMRFGLGGPQDFERYLKERIKAPRPAAPAASAAPALIAELNAAALLNRQLKTRLQYALGGTTVWVSGTFDRAQNAYVSILVNGQAPRFFNIRGLLDKEETLPVGSGSYKLFLNPNVFNQLKSEIVLENSSNEDEQVRITIKKLLDSIGAVGDEVKSGDQSYRVFYTDNIKEGALDPTQRTFTFLLTEPNGDIHVFLVPEELLPASGMAIFKMFKDKPLGLERKDGKLRVYENP